MNRHASMNRIFRLVWNESLAAYVPAAETTRGRGKSSKRKLIAAALSLSAGIAQAGPTGGQVTAGSGTITQSGSTTTILQASQNLSLNWRTFNLASQETVDFVQPNAVAFAVNRILDTNGSVILGHLNANGQVYLINPNGVLFGKGAEVNVGGLVASTLDLNDGTLGLASKTFSDAGTGNIVNDGTLNAAAGGAIALLGNHVSNGGVISAQLGTVALGAGSAATLTFHGSHLVSMQIGQGVLNSIAANGGLICADGGRVLMTAGAQKALLASVVNNTGVIEARTIENHAGTITLFGGMEAGTVDVGGTLDAGAPNGGRGGFIETSAAHVQIADAAKVTTAAAMGLNGTWLIDPKDFNIAPVGGDETGTQLSSALGGGNVTIQSSSGATAGSGNINVNDTVAWSANALTLVAQNNININMAMNGSGSASLALQYGQIAVNAGNLRVYNVNAPVNLPAGANFSTKLGSDGPVTNFTVITALGAAGDATTAPATATLQGMAATANLGMNFALGANIDASNTNTITWNGGAGFTPIGNSPAFTGIFDGLGHTIANLYINLPALNDYAGLFGAATNVIQHIGLIGGNVTGGSYVGMLVGGMSGSIANSYATGTVTGTRYDGKTGGLVAVLSGDGTITDSYAAVTVTGRNAGGGLVGASYGTVVINSYATGAVSAATFSGGLVGINTGTITDSYASGLVSASIHHGGLSGFSNGSITNSYWDLNTSGQSSSSSGGTGLTSTQMQIAANFNGFAFTTTPGAAGDNWVMVDTDGYLNNAGAAKGATLPMLASEYSTSIGNAHQLQLMAMAPGANYTLAVNIDASATTLAVVNGHGDIWDTAGGFVPVGTSSHNFTGSFDGLGHAISNLGVYQASSSQFVGLFGLATGAIQNVGLIGGNVTGGAKVGMLAGESDGSITNSHAAGTVTGTGNAVNGTGGLVGHNGGSISGSDATVAVTGLRGTGGLVGSNYGPISNSYATGNVSGSSYVGGLVGYALAGGNISNSHATGQATGTGQYVGGLVGVINGTTVAHSYATGTAGGGTQVGGLVGSNSGGGTISDSYATGNVTGTADVGGLVGFFQDPQINFLSNAFYNVDQVTINGMHLVAAGGIFNAQYVDWFSHGETLSIANYVASLPAGSGGYYNVSSVQGLEDLLGFSESNAALNFRLTANLSLPQGFSIPYFAGSFDGGSHTLANLALATNNSEVGLFGYLPSSATTIANVGVSNVSVTGNEYVGGLVGYDKAGASISNSYASGSITGVSVVGGLVGRLNSGGGISNSYFSGSVTETSYAVGGLVGASYGTISTSYAQGSVTGTAYYIGGLVGLKYGSVTNSFYDKSSNPTLTGLSNYSHPIADVAGTVEGLTTAQFESPTTFTSATGANGNFNPAWNLSTAAAGSSGWFMYAGQTAPLLRSFMTPLTVGGGATIQVYDAIAFAPTVGNMVYSSPPDMTQLLGSLTITGTAASAVHTGTYTYVPGGLYSDQQGYLISYISSRLTINPAALNVSGTTVVSKVYDGSTVAALAGGSLIGLFGADSVSLTQAGSFATKNIGTGIAVTAADSLSGANAGDYVLVDPAGLTGNITPATLTVSGTTVGGKVYDGTTVALLTGGSLVGLIGADSVSLTQAGNFATKNAGSGIAVTAVDSLSGASAADYSIVEPTGLSGSILPAPPSTPGGPGGTSGLDALLLDALNARTQIVENFIYPQLGANPQEIDALPTIGMLATAADDASEDSTSRHKAIAVNVSMRIGANGSLKIENGGLRLPSTLVVGNK